MAAEGVKRLGLLLALAGGSQALACGHCIEDKVAAVYDHAQVQALAPGQQLAFVAVQGEPGRVARAPLARALAGLPGVPPESLRFSAEAGAAAFVFTPAAAPLATVLERLNRVLAPAQLRLLPMRVLDRPGRLQDAVP